MRRPVNRDGVPQYGEVGRSRGVRAAMDREAQIHKIVEEVAKKPVDVDRNGSLFESGLLDSFALVDLVSALEQGFGIKIPDSDLIPQRFDSIAKIEQYLATRLRE